MGTDVNTSKPVVLIVDDQYRTLHSLPRIISPDAFSPVWVPDKQHALNLLRKQPRQRMIIIVDLKSSGNGRGRISAPSHTDSYSSGYFGHRPIRPLSIAGCCTSVSLNTGLPKQIMSPHVTRKRASVTYGYTTDRKDPGDAEKST
jgi:hypothetical protein